MAKLLGIEVCTPAIVYLVLSFLLIIYSLFTLRIVWGLSVWIWTIIHVLIVLFWTFVLNAICNYGYTMVSWILVLFPIVVVLFGYLTNSY
jgi:hypothetical protein